MYIYMFPGKEYKAQFCVATDVNVAFMILSQDVAYISVCLILIQNPQQAMQLEVKCIHMQDCLKATIYNSFAYQSRKYALHYNPLLMLTLNYNIIFWVADLLFASTNRWQACSQLLLFFS